MYYQYSVTLPVYGLTPGEKIIFNSLVILSISLFIRLVLFFLAAGINTLIALSRDQLFMYPFLICSGLLIRLFVYGSHEQSAARCLGRLWSSRIGQTTLTRGWRFSCCRYGELPKSNSTRIDAGNLRSLGCCIRPLDILCIVPHGESEQNELKLGRQEGKGKGKGKGKGQGQGNIQYDWDI
jgi:hypothetical protein